MCLDTTNNHHIKQMDLSFHLPWKEVQYLDYVSTVHLTVTYFPVTDMTCHIQKLYNLDQKNSSVCCLRSRWTSLSALSHPCLEKMSIKQYDHIRLMCKWLFQNKGWLFLTLHILNNYWLWIESSYTKVSAQDILLLISNTYISPSIRFSCAMIRTDSRFAPSQWETWLQCNDVSHWLDASLDSVSPAWYMVISAAKSICQIL